MSSREGVRDSDSIRALRDLLKRTFNECRTAYESWAKRQLREIDLELLLSEAPSTHVTDPLISSVRRVINSGSESFYIAANPQHDGNDKAEWLSSFEEKIRNRPFKNPLFSSDGMDAPTLRYEPTTRDLYVNREHPFIDKLTFGGKNLALARLFASAELLLECQLEEFGMNRAAIANLLESRDRILRITAGYGATTALEVLRSLSVAKRDPDALEVAVGKAFQALGFDYERKGGNASGPDGVLYARLGRHGDTLADYTLVYDAKQTNGPSVEAAKADPNSLDVFRKDVGADYGFFAAPAYQAEYVPDGKLNRQIKNMEDCKVTLLKVDHLSKIVRLHYQHGITLTQLRTLFESANTVPEVDEWLTRLESELGEGGGIPLRVLLDGLEAEKHDTNAAPNIAVVRSKTLELRKFRPDRLAARLKAMEQIVGHKWIEVNEDSHTVQMHQTADQILKQLDRNIRDLEQDSSTHPE